MNNCFGAEKKTKKKGFFADFRKFFAHLLKKCFGA
jgi:hypothetical protein